MKFKNLTYLGLVALGLMSGYFLFRGGSDKPQVVSEHDQKESGVWTCSMHPQIRSGNTGKCPLCAMDLVFMDNHGLETSAFQFEMTEDALALADVQTMRVESKNTLKSSVRLSGLVMTNPETDAIQTTLFEGRIDKLYANYVGKKVFKGQKIGFIYSPELYLAQDKLLTSRSYKESHPKLYNAARNTLGLWKMTDAQIDELLETGKPIVDFPIYADVSGTVMEIIAKEGNFYKLGDPLYKVSNLKKVWVILDAYENQLNYLSVGQKIEIYLKAVPNKKISAEIDFIEPSINTTTRTAAVRVVLSNKDEMIKPGMFVEGVVDIAKVNIGETSSLFIPKSAVLWTGKRSIVYKKIYEDQTIFEFQEVELGNTMGGEYEILDGLQIGDEIVVNGAFTVDASAQLNGKKSMMTPGKKNKELHGTPKTALSDIPQKVKISTDFKDYYKEVLTNYIDLKDALVDSDMEKAKEILRRLEINYSDLRKSNSEYYKSVSNTEEILKKLLNSETIDELRNHFKHFSKELISVTTSMDRLDTPVYIQFCPMADNNKGAFWMSFQKEIRNPYFGEAMLICGSVEKVLQ